MNRTELLLGGSRLTDTILELGAGYNSIAPRRNGWRTHVVDHASREDLRTKYATANVDVDLIEDVDTIWHTGPLHEAVPASLLGQIDTLIASHVLEHLPDLIGFLQSADRLVSPGGLLSVALPDRRYCYDCFRAWTATGDLLDAQQRGLTKHSLRTAYDHFAYSAVVDGNLAWGPWQVARPKLLDPFLHARAIVAEHLNRAEVGYDDYHAWQFTPAGFELCILELRALGRSEWWVDRIVGDMGFEFFIHLRHSPRSALSDEALQERRTDLLLQRMAEMRRQADWMLGEAAAAPAPALGPRTLRYKNWIRRIGLGSA